MDPARIEKVHSLSVQQTRAIKSGNLKIIFHMDKPSMIYQAEKQVHFHKKQALKNISLAVLSTSGRMRRF